VAPGQWELPAGCRPFFEVLEGQLAAMPGIARFALSSPLPLQDRGAGMAMHVEDHPRPPSEPAHWLEQHVVSPDYFQVLGIPIEAGRPLTAEDRPSAPSAVVISRAIADRYWPGQSPIGKRIRPVWIPDWWTVVGVAADVPPADRAVEPALDFYSPLAQEPREQFYVLAETGLDLPAFADGLGRALRATDPTVPVSQVRTLREIRAETAAAPRVTSLLLGSFALLALVLGAIGVYGVLSYGVAQRRREIGIRMAIGADVGAVRRMVLGRAGRLMATGLALGLLGAWFGVALLERFLYGVSPRDPATFVTAVLVFAAVGLIAAYLPVRRATAVRPTVALRDS
jgi:predicted permease